MQAQSAPALSYDLFADSDNYGCPCHGPPSSTRRKRPRRSSACAKSVSSRKALSWAYRRSLPSRGREYVKQLTYRRSIVRGGPEGVAGKRTALPLQRKGRSLQVGRPTKGAALENHGTTRRHAGRFGKAHALYRRRGRDLRTVHARRHRGCGLGRVADLWCDLSGCLVEAIDPSGGSARRDRPPAKKATLRPITSAPSVTGGGGDSCSGPMQSRYGTSRLMSAPIGIETRAPRAKKNHC